MTTTYSYDAILRRNKTVINTTTPIDHQYVYWMPDRGNNLRTTKIGWEHIGEYIYGYTYDARGTTIDFTAIGRVADAATKVPGTDFTTVWSQASAAFCNQASGIVNAFVSNSAYRGVNSIF